MSRRSGGRKASLMRYTTNLGLSFAVHMIKDSKISHLPQTNAHGAIKMHHTSSIFADDF